VFSRLATIGLVLFGFQAHAFEYQCLKGTVKELEEVLGDTPNVFQCCYRYGRSQSFADVLAHRERKLRERKTNNPSHQARCIFEAQNMHLSLYDHLRVRIETCDPDFLKQRYAQAAKGAAPDINQLMKMAKRDLRRLRSDEPPVACFHLGRLGFLVRKFEEDLTRKAARGIQVDPIKQQEANAARRFVTSRIKNCELSPNEAFN